jgi:hypothetical protein
MKRLFFLLFTLFQAYPLLAQLNWQERNGSFAGNVYALLETKSGVLIAGTQYGILRCTDGGNTWILDAGDLRSADISALATDSSGMIFAATHGIGVYRSVNNGQTWQATNLNNSDALSLAASPDGMAFAGLYDNGIYYYDSSSGSWFPTGLPNMRVSAITFLSADTIIAGTLGAGLQLSTDGGTTWMNEGWGGVNFYCLYTKKDTLYAGTNGGVLRSTDRGHTWVQWGLDNTNIYTFVQGPDAELWAAGYGGIFEQQGNTSNWNNISYNDRIVWTLVMQTGVGIIAGTNGTGLYRSGDTAKSWVCLALGTTTVLQGNPYSYDTQRNLTADSNYMYLGVTGSGVLVSTDEGWSWNRSINGLFDPFVWYVAASPWGEVFAETDTGLFVSDDHGQSWKWISDTLFIGYLVEQIKFDAHGGILLGRYADSWTNTPSYIYRSSDRGKTWKTLFIGGQHFTGTNDGGILIGTPDSGVYRSIDDGKTWERWSGPTEGITCLTLLDSSLVFAGTDSGRTFISTDDGISWNRLNESSSSIGIGVGPTLIQNGDYIAAANDELVISTDKGRTWDSAGFQYYWINTLLTDDKGKTFLLLHEGTVYAAEAILSNIAERLTTLPPNSLQCFPSYPNPCTTATIILFDAKKTEQASLFIFDIDGTIVKQRQVFMAIAGHNQLEIQTGSLRTGKYYCIIQSGNDRAISQFYVVR